MKQAYKLSISTKACHMCINMNLTQFYHVVFGTGTWDVLIEVVAAMQHAEGIVKREWLVGAVEISCVSRYPSLVSPPHSKLIPPK